MGGIGEDTLHDPALATAWFSKSAAQGHAPAQFSLGHLLSQGDGVARDEVQAAGLGHWRGQGCFPETKGADGLPSVTIGYHGLPYGYRGLP